MKALTKWQKKSETVHVVYGVSIIILAIIVSVLAHTVISGKEFPLTGSPVKMEKIYPAP